MCGGLRGGGEARAGTTLTLLADAGIDAGVGVTADVHALASF